MAIFTIDNQIFQLRENVCNYTGKYQKGNVQYNLYIKMPNVCNANCAFCNKNKESKPFDLENLISSIHKAKEVIPIYSISITGGEPFLDFDLLLTIVKEIQKDFGPIEIVINSNGTNIERAGSLLPYISRIHVSRHHYNDDVNRKIFGNCKSIPNLSTIRGIANLRKGFIQLNCLLIKGYIDSVDEIEKYLKQDIKTGFIGLMPINQYSKDNFIDYQTIFPIVSEKHLTVGRMINPQFDRENLRVTCSCLNALYQNNDHFIEYYARSVEWLECPTNNYIIYDGQKLVGKF